MPFVRVSVSASFSNEEEDVVVVVVVVKEEIKRSFLLLRAENTPSLSLSHETTTTPKPFERLGRAYNINMVRLVCGDRRFLISLTSGNWRDFYCLGFESHVLKCKAKSCQRRDFHQSAID